MGIRERKERERSLRKSQILAAAEKVFKEDGFEQASLEHIAERAEISRGTIYFHFNTREELYGTILLNRTNELFEKLDRIAASGDSPEATLEKMVIKYFDQFLEFPDHCKMLGRPL